MEVMERVKQDARRYLLLTGRPLGVTGEVAEYEAARLLGVKLAVVRQAGYDAIDRIDHADRLLQIKGRYLPHRRFAGQRIGTLGAGHAWDALLVVLLEEDFNAFEIWEIDRSTALANSEASRGLRLNFIRKNGRKRWPA